MIGQKWRPQNHNSKFEISQKRRQRESATPIILSLLENNKILLRTTVLVLSHFHRSCACVIIVNTSSSLYSTNYCHTRWRFSRCDVTQFRRLGQWNTKDATCFLALNSSTSVTKIWCNFLLGNSFALKTSVTYWYFVRYNWQFTINQSIHQSLLIDTLTPQIVELRYGRWYKTKRHTTKILKPTLLYGIYIWINTFIVPFIRSSFIWAQSRSAVLQNDPTSKSGVVDEILDGTLRASNCVCCNHNYVRRCHGDTGQTILCIEITRNAAPR